MKIRRIIVTLLLVLSLSATSVFAVEPAQSEATGSNAQVQTEQSSTQSAAPKVTSNIIKKGKYYYYKDPKTGKIRTKAGFVKDNGSRYYIEKNNKGRIATSKTFKVGKKKYRAASNGKIKTGVYKWGKKYYYSNSKGEWIRSKKLVTWKGNLYLIDKNGQIMTNNTFSYNDVPYLTNSKGVAKELELPDAGDNEIVKVARAQLGIKTGRKYWTSYFGTRFIDSDITPWCGTFVYWVYKKAGKYSKIKGVGNLAYVPSYTRFASKRGKWVKKANAKPGDIIVFGKLGRHVGIVEGVSNGCIITIEGNTVDLFYKSGSVPGQVQRKAYKITNKDIRGIIRP